MLQIIGFVFEWLAREAFLQPGLLLVDGSSTYLLANLGPEGAAVVLQPLGFAAAQVVLFAVNNNPDVQQPEGGSHWSLLAYSAADCTFWHYDSAAGSNQQAARRVFQAAAPPGAKLVDQATPQQQNGYDCGIYVLAIARLLCQRHARHGQRVRFDIGADDVTPTDVAALRTELLELITKKTGAADT
jgi:sentrin-specific protease 8